MEKSLCLIILAAGQSRRMGTIKQLLPWKDVTLLENTLQVALQSAFSEIILVLGANREVILPKIAPHLEDDRLTVAINDDWSSGLASSLRVGLEMARNISGETLQAVGFLLADLPFVRSEDIDSVLNFYTRLPLGDKNLAIVVPYYGDKAGHPVIFSQCYFSEIEKLTGDRGANSILKNNGKNIYRLSLDNWQAVCDCDNREEYASYLARIER
ncbi:nucleotidyltransferase family protein [bacterium]|nr:nucleotidyltransferase family protein [bacterium]